MQPNHVDSQNAHPTSGIAASGPASIDPDIESDSDPSAPATGHRDSVGSIIDDPFFQTYDPAVQAAAVSEDDDQSDGSSVYQSLEDEDHEHLFHDTKGHNFGKAAKQAKRKSGGGKKVKPDSDDNEPSQYWPPPRRESLTATPSSYWSQSSPTMESFNIAVIGSTGVGKSSFVQRVLGLSRPPISNASSVRMLVDNNSHAVTLLELDLEYFELNPTQPIQWPKQINGHIVPRVDAALILYDVTNHESVRELSQTLEENGETFSRRRAQSAANLEAPDVGTGRPISQHSKHSRASSDFSLLKGFSNPPISENYRAQSSRSPRQGHTASSNPEAGELGQAQTLNNMLRTPGIRLDRPSTDSFLDVDESDAESYRYSDDIPILQRNDDNTLDKQAKMAGVTFDELVDRLLAPRLTRIDNNFSDVFLCLYRKFAAPGELFTAILTRLDKVRDDKTAHYLSKTATQLRIIEVVAKWVSLYPGDFARPQTRRNLEEFIRHLSTEPIFSIAAQHMRRHLQFNVVEDDDTGWANSDETSDKLASEILSKDMNELSSGVSVLTVESDMDVRPSGSSEVSLADRSSSVSSQVHFHTFEDYERAASNLEPTDNLPMNKFRYHIFMDIPDDDVADELTRIDWIMFSSIRIRDFVRHVSLSASQKERCKSLRNVNRMINHFNHVAKWVANMILLRDKAKHRALILEKFMNISLKLRQLNNYNGLAAILAGVNGTAIHRLNQTRTLVPAEVQKRFARLGILMGTQKSHFAYRLAWENSSLPRIPFIPLHRRDLVSAEEGSRTFVGADGDRINWKKFEVLGEVLLPIMKSQSTSYPNLTKHDTARELILGCRMPTDEEDIYQRSVQVESGSGNFAEPPKKKFPWFAK
ncbi:aimless (aleA) [Fusarium agapanthi]|uniref:Aimless (AleA) n=1 Tax=Fusarium agapanthi TaxID=1803897 RepID=A0A9P5BBE2_9HYPO|nr:aimless (aleA) [Fusarium agapanthi]